MITRELLARRGVRFNAPISDEKLDRLRAEFDHQLPEGLVQLLRIADGFGIDGGDGVEFLDSDEILDYYQDYREWTSQYILIAMTGGAEWGYISRHDGSIKRSRPGELFDEPLETLAPSLESWLQADEMFPQEPEPDISSIEPVHIYLEQMPPGGLKDLVAIKNALPNITSVAQIKTIAQQLPAVLSTQFFYCRACDIIRDLGILGDCLTIRLASDPRMRLPLD